MNEIDRVKKSMVDAWSFIKKHMPDRPLSDEQRSEAFRELNELMRSHGVKDRTPFGDFAFALFAAAFDLVAAAGERVTPADSCNT